MTGNGVSSVPSNILASNSSSSCLYFPNACTTTPGQVTVLRGFKLMLNILSLCRRRKADNQFTHTDEPFNLSASQVREIAQWAKALVAKSDNQNSTLRTHTVRELTPTACLLTSAPIQWHKYAHVHI